ncbi:galactose-1-phosphate uridylyltransferase [candidate division KSB1 bacterium]|nr:galactose-1-phosphate uridylyltransferase [candidate division KSB1 bacterium]
MPEFRKDPIVGHWVIISKERSQRGSDWIIKPHYEKINGFCPFCEGNEDKTPPEIYALRSNDSKKDGPGWKIRIVPNKYPALLHTGKVSPEHNGIFHKLNGIGAHEVFVETPDHAAKFTDFPPRHIFDILKAFQYRILHLKQDRRLKYVIIFKNEGFAAGASLEHSHSQLIGTPIVPKAIKEKLEGFRKYFSRHKTCVFCDLIKRERLEKTRVVFESKHFTALAPFASRFPFESWILPINHIANYENMEDDYYFDLAINLKDVLKKIKMGLNDPAYNLILHSCPFTHSKNIDFHWHIEIIPKISSTAGFEWGSGIHINPVPPEAAAEWLREN